MAQYEHLPIYKAAFDLQIYFETIVRHFSRYAQIHISNGKHTGVWHRQQPDI